MLNKVILLAGLLSVVYAKGELSILHNPTSIDFKGNEKLDSDSISDVLGATLGYSVAKPSTWGGLYINEPFNLPNSIVTVAIDGVEGLKIQQGKNPEYSILGSSTSDSIDNFASIVNHHGRIVDIDLSEGYDAVTQYKNLFGDIDAHAPNKKTSALKSKVHPEDKLFLQQLDILDAISEKLSTVDQKPVLLLVRISLRNLLAEHGAGSAAAREAIDLLSHAIERLSESAEASYKGNVVVAVVASNDEVRAKREARVEREAPSPIPDNLNLAEAYDEDFPIIFNIILWFGIVFAFSLIAICYVIATMDPGRESIIYRMTLNRMKKEN